MSDTCPTCQHERFRHDGNTPSCIECDCNDLWGDGEYFIYSDLSGLVKRIDMDKLAALLAPYFSSADRAHEEHYTCADAVLAALPDLMGGGEQA